MTYRLYSGKYEDQCLLESHALYHRRS